MTGKSKIEIALFAAMIVLNSEVVSWALATVLLGMICWPIIKKGVTIDA